MSNNYLKNLRTLFTGIGGALPTANPLHRGVFAVKKAASTEDEVHVGLQNSSGAMVWRRVPTTTLADSTYVNVSGDTMTGALLVQNTVDVEQTDSEAFTVKNDGATTYFNVNTNAGGVDLVNAANLKVWSDGYSTLKLEVVGSSGDITSKGKITLGSAGVQILTGTGDPEGVHTAVVGSLFLRTDGGASTTLYVKETGSGNTGWSSAA
jgi:hypothetical protein